MKTLQRFVAPALIVAVSALALMGSVRSARAEVNVYFRVGVPTAPLDLEFVGRPHTVLIPDSRVYIVRGADYDVYRYGGYYWAYDDGYWYRARAYDGPWVGVSYVSVPQPVIYVPAQYRPHWVEVAPAYRVPPGHMKRYYKQERHEDRAERRYYKHHRQD